jgi:hypothetical protein
VSRVPKTVTPAVQAHRDSRLKPAAVGAGVVLIVVSWAVLAWSPVAAAAVGAVAALLLGWQALVTRERWIAVAFVVALASMVVVLFIVAAVDISRYREDPTDTDLQQLPGDGPVGY